MITLSLAQGRPADITVFDPEGEWTVEPQRFKSRSRNTPFLGWKLSGVVAATFVGGRKVFQPT